MAIVPPVPPSLDELEVISVSDETLHFDYPGSDIVLRSELCDSHIFRVPKLYLVNCSPVLGEIIVRSISNTSDVPNGEERGPLPVVKLKESGAIIHSLLTFIFPVVPILPSTSEEIMKLLAVAQKYQMDSVLSHVRGIIARKDPPFIRPETAFHIYFLAQHHELHQEALQAARVTLRLPMVIEDLGDNLDFPGMTGAYLHELWKYHEQVRTHLKSGILEFRNSGLPNDVKSLRCEMPSCYTTSGRVISDYSQPPIHPVPLWLDNYSNSIANAPHLFDLISFETEWACHLQEKISRCCSCIYLSGQVIRTFWGALTAVVNKAIEKADSTLTLVKVETNSEYVGPSSVPLCLNVPEANIILRSSDQTNFRVHKSLLSMSSPFFEHLLSLPQPTEGEIVDGLPVVQLPEDADLLNSLVSLLYPIPPVIPSSYDRVFALLAACQKYDMVSIQSYIRAEIQRGTFPSPAEAQAFSAYAKASSLGLIPEMENAAQLTLGQPMTFESLGEVLRQFKGPTLCELVRYRVTTIKTRSWNGAAPSYVLGAFSLG